MGFFTLSDGSRVGDEKEFSVGGFSDPIPEDTDVLAEIMSIAWADPGEFIKQPSIAVTWGVLQPKEYRDRKLYQKLQVESPDAKKRDKALRMLAAIDANHGGKLAKLDASPTDQQLASALASKIMALKVGVFVDENKENDKGRNYIKAVSPRKGVVDEPASAVKKAAPAKKAVDLYSDDIPF